MKDAYTPVTNPVVDSSNPIGDGKTYEATKNIGHGKTEVQGTSDIANNEGSTQSEMMGEED